MRDLPHHVPMVSGTRVEHHRVPTTISEGGMEPDSTSSDNPDYVTILPAAHDHACVAIMHWAQDDYAIKKISQAVTQNAAVSLAKSWAAAMRLEIR